MPKRTQEQKDARKIADAARRRANIEEVLAKERKYRKEHREELRAYKYKWKKDHPEKSESRRKYKKAHPRTEKEKLARKAPAALAKSRAASLRWNRENAERHAQRKKEYEASPEGQKKRRERFQRYYAEHRAELAEKKKRYREANRLAFALRQRRRDALKAKSGGSITPAEIMDLWQRQDGKCIFFHVCGNILAEGKRRQWHADHIESLRPQDKSRPPGPNVIDNIQLLCGPCNMKKHTMDPYVFAQLNGLLFCDIVEIAKGKKRKKAK